MVSKYEKQAWRWGKVTSIDDPYNAGRIKVRLTFIDNDIDVLEENNNDTGLLWCEPLLPKYLNVIPEVGTLVRITTYDLENQYYRRLYVGPVIPQQSPKDLLYSDDFNARLKVDSGSPNSDVKIQQKVDNYTPNWEINADSYTTFGLSKGDWKVYPNKNDIAFLGRKNADFIIRGNRETFFDEIQLRAGKINPNTLSSDLPSLNFVNPGYITINFTEASAFQQEGITDVYQSLNIQKDRSHINLVADKINLISHEGSNIKGIPPAILEGIEVTKQINTENEKLHPLVYGDVLWEFLTIIREYIEGHTHPYANLAPDPSGPTKQLTDWFNQNMGTGTNKPTSDGSSSYLEVENCTFLSKGVKTN